MSPDRLRKLAGRLDALADKDDRRLRREREIEQLRRHGALALHTLCATVVDSLNPMLTRVNLELAPPVYGENDYEDTGRNLFQIQAHGRIVQITFEGSETTTSTEDFRTPYILKGAVRWFNQERLEREEMEEQWIFYCLGKEACAWRFLDPRTHRTGVVDADYLIGLLDQLI